MQALKDGSALFNMPGAASAYSHLHFHPGKQMITHVRFEALTDSSLPNNGPGRAKDGQFRIFAFEVHVYAKNAQRQKKLIEIKKGVTNQASEDEPLDNTWDFLSDTGWLAPERNTPHTPVTAVFVLEKPIQCTMNTGLMIRWEAGNRDYRTPGRVRISIADATKPKKGKVRPKKQTAK